LSRRLVERRLVLATHNPGKLAELGEPFRARGIEMVSSTALGLAEPAETGETFVANARIKAHATARTAGLPALADDSGLEVVGLGGRPGVYAARWAGPGRDFGVAMARVRDELAARFGGFAAADRRASFVAALCLAWPDDEEVLAEGRVEGELVDPPRGEGGFGYDPMFVPEGHTLTFAEMPPARKQALSHRGRALERLIALCLES